MQVRSYHPIQISTELNTDLKRLSISIWPTVWGVSPFAIVCEQFHYLMYNISCVIPVMHTDYKSNVL